MGRATHFSRERHTYVFTGMLVCTVGKTCFLISACSSTEKASSAGVVTKLIAGWLNSRGTISSPEPSAGLRSTQTLVQRVPGPIALEAMTEDRETCLTCVNCRRLGTPGGRPTPELPYTSLLLRDLINSSMTLGSRLQLLPRTKAFEFYINLKGVRNRAVHRGRQWRVK